jgi:hypothetical protein
MQLRLYSSLALLALALAGPGQSLAAAGMTAFDLVKEGDKVVAPEAKDKITQIRSEKSTANLVPDIWHTDYFDTTAAFKITEVTFVSGKVTEITRPKHFFSAFSGTKQLEWRKLKVNSDRALAIALKEPTLQKLHVQATQFWLDWGKFGSTWKIRFWAFRQSKPDQIVEIGDLYLSTKTGEIFKNDLHPRSAD